MDSERDSNASRGVGQSRAWAELAAMRADSPRDAIHGPRIAALLESAAELERVSDWAAEMQLGAEGFDNTDSARLYAHVQERLLIAAGEIARACETLAKRSA